jgi:hypothetical protein
MAPTARIFGLRIAALTIVEVREHECRRARNEGIRFRPDLADRHANEIEGAMTRDCGRQIRNGHERRDRSFDWDAMMASMDCRAQPPGRRPIPSSGE